MLIVKGVNVFPSQIETVILNQGYEPNYQIEVDRVNYNDTIDVILELLPSMAELTPEQIAARERKLVAGLKSMLGILVNVHLVPPKSIARSEGKAVRVVDKRNLYR